MEPQETNQQIQNQKSIEHWKNRKGEKSLLLVYYLPDSILSLIVY